MNTIWEGIKKYGLIAVLAGAAAIVQNRNQERQIEAVGRKVGEAVGKSLHFVVVDEDDVESQPEITEEEEA